MIETIYIARHGFRLNWMNTNWKSPTGLPRDPPLAAYGEVQAQELADHFLALPEEKRPTIILSSPYYRCLQTSKPTSQVLEVPIYVEHGLSEWYSPVAPGTGLHPRPSSATVMQTYFSEIDPSWSSIWYPTRRGEDVEALHERANGKHALAVKHKNILLVSHAATVIVLCRALLAQPDLPLRVGCCSISEFSRKPNASGVLGAWEAKYLASGSHLKEGASRDWGLEDIQIANGKVISDQGVPAMQEEEEDNCGPQIHRSSL
ncbi:histidine phosphatase superfamily [Suillus discolor]|uniref:Histidine phosphatase superfamily n=1 Tax=Suillus discolor TaxID=1912936 RepID=A0A9P7K1C5_9AGAM|nr:histidine phosphatase superfamily [Suillus discolor]KAG2120964.1 histidine phosphatase superfamily [Suillus discolor]